MAAKFPLLGSTSATSAMAASASLRPGLRIVSQPTPLAELPNKTALGFFFLQLVQALRVWGAVPLRRAVSL